MSNYVSAFARMGIKVDAAELVSDSTVEVISTITQYEKISGLIPDVKLITIRDNRVISEVPKGALDSAIASNAKAPRGTGATCQIDSETVYHVTTSDDAVNEVTGARWNSSANDGELFVNGLSIAIGTGEAQDFYEVDPDSDSDPTRKVFYVEFTTDEGDSDVLTSYGITNLIRRVVSYPAAITS